MPLLSSIIWGEMEAVRLKKTLTHRTEVNTSRKHSIKVSLKERKVPDEVLLLPGMSCLKFVHLFSEIFIASVRVEWLLRTIRCFHVSRHSTPDSKCPYKTTISLITIIINSRTLRYSNSASLYQNNTELLVTELHS